MFGSRWAQKPPVGTPIDRSADLSEGLIGAWVFNEGTGPTVTNVAFGDTLTGTAITWNAVNGPTFNGTSSYFTAAAANSRYVPATWTIAARVKTNSASASQEIMRLDNGTSARDLLFRLTSSGKTESISFLSGTNADAVGATTLSTNTWYNLAATFAGVTQTVYVNGVPDGTATGSGTQPTNYAQVYIGCYEGLSEFFNGAINYVFMWNRVLASGELQSIGQNQNAIWQVFKPLRSVMWSYAAMAASFKPWIYGDQIEDLFG